MSQNLPRYAQYDIPLILVAAGTDEVLYWTNKTGTKLRVKALAFTPWTARTANATNYTDISVENEGTEIASEQTTVADTGNLSAGVPLTLAITGTGSSLELADGDTLAFKKTDAGAGLALDGMFHVSVEAMR